MTGQTKLTGMTDICDVCHAGVSAWRISYFGERGRGQIRSERQPVGTDLRGRGNFARGGWCFHRQIPRPNTHLVRALIPLRARPHALECVTVAWGPVGRDVKHPGETLCTLSRD